MFITCKESKARDNSSMSLGETSWKYSTIRVSHYKWSEMKVDWDKLKMCAMSPQESCDPQLCLILCNAHGLSMLGSSVYGLGFPRQEDWVDSHSLLRIFPTQESSTVSSIRQILLPFRATKEALKPQATTKTIKELLLISQQWR